MRAPILLLTFLTSWPALADEDRVAKRATCQAEVLSRVKPRGTINAERAQKLIERRLELVRTCMERPALASTDQPVTTGTVKSAKRLP